MEKIKLTEVESHPVCPYCEKKLPEIHWHKVRGTGLTGLGFGAVYSCPHCAVDQLEPDLTISIES